MHRALPGRGVVAQKRRGPRRRGRGGALEGRGESRSRSSRRSGGAQPPRPLPLGGAAREQGLKHRRGRLAPRPRGRRGGGDNRGGRRVAAFVALVLAAALAPLPPPPPPFRCQKRLLWLPRRQVPLYQRVALQGAGKDQRARGSEVESEVEREGSRRRRGRGRGRRRKTRRDVDARGEQERRVGGGGGEPAPAAVPPRGRRRGPGERDGDLWGRSLFSLLPAEDPQEGD